MSFKARLIIVFLCLNSPLIALAHAEPTLTPTQIVYQWLAWYPKQLSQAAALTTNHLRHGLSQQDWIEQSLPFLHALQFQYLEGKILEEDSGELTATVTVQVRLYMVIGEVRQVETYSLKKVDGHWRIDTQEIQEDRVIGRTL
jgi:hypothetical protein